MRPLLPLLLSTCFLFSCSHKANTPEPMNDNSLLLFVSSYGSADEECIRLYAFDPETGESQYVSGLSGISNPSFLCFGPDDMLANDLGTDRIHLFPITKGESVISQPGKHPRNFTLSPDGCFLLVACRDSHVVQVFSRDADSGLLTDTGHDITQDKPVCVLF